MLYKIFTTTANEPLGIVEEVNYIKISPTSGCYIGCDFEEAIGIAYNSVAYNLLGHNEIPNAETAFAQELDEGDIITKLNRATEELTKSTLDNAELIIDMQIASNMTDIGGI